jgi:hypothetical protein
LRPVLEVKVKLSLYRPWRPLGSREFDAPKFSDIRHTHMAARLSALRVGRVLPSGRFLVLISVRGSVDPQVHSAAGRIR